MTDNRPRLGALTEAAIALICQVRADGKPHTRHSAAVAAGIRPAVLYKALGRIAKRQQSVPT